MTARRSRRPLLRDIHDDFEKVVVDFPKVAKWVGSEIKNIKKRVNLPKEPQCTVWTLQSEHTSFSSSGVRRHVAVEERERERENMRERNMRGIYYSLIFRDQG